MKWTLGIVAAVAVVFYAVKRKKDAVAMADFQATLTYEPQIFGPNDLLVNP